MVEIIAGRPVIFVTAERLARIHYRFSRRGRLPMWTVYRPIVVEYPGKWVARMFFTLPESTPTRCVIAHDTLEEVRSFLPPGLTRMARHPNDLPEIEEVWL